MSGGLSTFQKNTLLGVMNVFSEKGLVPPHFNQLGEKEISLHGKIIEKSIEIYIYNDGAEFFGGQVDRRFEAPDYDTLDDMSDDFVKNLDNFLFHPEQYVEPRTIFRVIKEFFQGKSKK